MERADRRPSAALGRLANGYQVTQAIHVAAVLGIADLNMLAMAGGQGRTPEELAGLVGRAGFRLAGVTPTASEVSVVEGAAG